MSSTSTSSVCPRCGAVVSIADANCPACYLTLGAPNVREVDSAAERAALAEREARAKKRARQRQCLDHYEELASHLENRSGVVVTMPATVAMGLFENPSALYTGQESQVLAGTRTPPLPPHDRERAGVAGILFGSYAKEIRYGALSMNTWGLRTYGEVHCRLREKTIADRVTFMETNSYHFVRQHQMLPGDVPPMSYRAVWENRCLLALAKLEPRLAKEQDPADWPSILVQSDGKDRSKDEFIEAHIYGPFNMDSIENVEIDEEKTTSELRKLLARVVVVRQH